MSRDHTWPIRGQYPDPVITLNQEEDFIELNLLQSLMMDAECSLLMDDDNFLLLLKPKYSIKQLITI